MKLSRVFASLLLLAATSTASLAAGVVDLTWDNCTSVLVDKTVVGGEGVTPTTVDIFVSVLGQSQTSQAYQCITIAGSPGGIQDAWRFDATGCEGPSFFTLNHLAPPLVAKTCPSFSGTVPGLQIKRYDYDLTTGKEKIELASAYPAPDANQVPQGNPLATNPLQRYFLANYHFDLTYASAGPTNPAAGTCGGVSVPVCFGLTSASWLDLSGNEIPWAFGKDHLTSNDPNNSSRCPGSVPAQTRTWGSIKGQYR